MFQLHLKIVPFRPRMNLAKPLDRWRASMQRIESPAMQTRRGSFHARIYRLSPIRFARERQAPPWLPWKSREEETTNEAHFCTATQHEESVNVHGARCAVQFPGKILPAGPLL